MKKIILNTENKISDLTEALNTVQHRCTARTLSAENIVEILNGILAKYPIAKAKMNGVSVHYDGAEHFPNAYRHIPESTHFTAVFNGKCWVITEICRDTCPNRTGFNAVVTLTDTAKMALFEAMEKIAC